VSNASGVLYVVATPIGNLSDISARATEILANVDLIAAEDTRHSAKLLTHLGVTTPTAALHDHNEHARLPKILQRLTAGDSVALISDAGTPLISDPGFKLVRAAHDAGVPVIPVPGPSALTAALSVSGVPSSKFVFEGFLPSKGAARRQRLSELAVEPRSIVFYEAPHRIQDMLEDLSQSFGGERAVTLARELTKKFETVLSMSLQDLVKRLDDDPDQRRGEFVLVVAGCGADDTAWRQALEMLEVLLEELPLKRAVALTARLTGEKKNQLYQAALERSGME